MPYALHADVFDQLSARQKEILRLVARHHQAKEIARILKISENTVKTHTEEARRRLGVSRTIYAARLLSEHEAMGAGLPLDVGPPPKVMGEAEQNGQAVHHEQALHIPNHAAASYDHSVRRTEADLAFTGRREQGPLRQRDDRHLEAYGPDHEFREADLYYGHRDSMVDGPKRLFGWRLDELSPLQCGALILTITVGLGFMAVALLATSATTFQAIQGLIG